MSVNGTSTSYQPQPSRSRSDGDNTPSCISSIQLLSAISLPLATLLLPYTLATYASPCPCCEPEGCWTQALLQFLTTPILFVYHILLVGAIFMRYESYMTDQYDYDYDGPRRGRCNYCHPLVHHVPNYLGKYFSVVLMVYYINFEVLVIVLHNMYERYYWLHPKLVNVSWILAAVQVILGIALLLFPCFEPFDFDHEEDRGGGYEEIP